ncbi:MAG: acyl-CoA dehydrogenase [Alphaproteobacteria bacterium]|nr:acyl-CoA dehydrogenase [Alphaproteobacteria bacterium]
MSRFRYDLQDLPREAEAIRDEVRAFLRTALPDYPPALRAHSWGGFDPDFSRKLGERGWIGMTWPKQHGGHERTALERYVVLEELLAHGAPVSAHWIADRQSGPLLLRYGTEEQKRKYLPRIAAGACFFSIGMSEPDSGSDLAAVKSRAERDGKGWRINGRKIWTTNAHRNHALIALLRTRSGEGAKHSGLTQFVLDLKTPGIEVRPIKDLTGRSHFNEVTFTDVRVGDEARLGSEGDGWTQVTSELAFERSGPERYLSSIELVHRMIAKAGKSPPPRIAEMIGRITARMLTLRHMSLALAGMLQRGENPATEAALVKDLGTTLEQDIPEIAHAMFDAAPSDHGQGDDYAQVLGFLVQSVPSFSLRGGTREILRGMVARGLGLR